MLIQQLTELIQYGFVYKTTFEGYPLQVEYHLTDRARKIFQAISIMQDVGIEMIIEDYQEDVLC